MNSDAVPDPLGDNPNWIGIAVAATTQIDLKPTGRSLLQQSHPLGARKKPSLRCLKLHKDQFDRGANPDGKVSGLQALQSKGVPHNHNNY